MVQVAALSSPDRARNVANAIGGRVEQAGRLYRIRTGPFTTRGEAEALDPEEALTRQVRGPVCVRAEALGLIDGCVEWVAELGDPSPPGRPDVERGVLLVRDLRDPPRLHRAGFRDDARVEHR